MTCHGTDDPVFTSVSSIDDITVNAVLKTLGRANTLPVHHAGHRAGGARAWERRMSEGAGVSTRVATARGIGAPEGKMCRCGRRCSSPLGAQGGYLMYPPEFYLLSVGYGAHGTVYE